MTERSVYGNWPALSELYLEDSYVLEILESPSCLIFQMEFVLREGHPKYRAPKQDEQYCYERGKLIFQGIRALRWLERTEVLSFDAKGEHDLGNIDQLYQENGWYMASGDWGEVTFMAQNIEVEMDENQKQ